MQIDETGLCMNMIGCCSSADVHTAGDKALDLSMTAALTLLCSVVFITRQFALDCSTILAGLIINKRNTAL